MGFIDVFRDKDEDQNNRQRWKSQLTFVLAAIGSAVGLGNFWRFPYLCYKWGGALFFVPYLLSLFLLGIPLLMLEFSLGQKFQRGDIGVFRGIHPRLAGIGLASVFASYAITFYYNVIIAWAFIYLCVSFKNPLPWSIQYERNPEHNKCDNLFITQEYFFRNLVHTIDSNCQPFNTSEFIAGDETQISEFSWQIWLACAATWFIVYFCVFKGVKSSSYVVWVTVPLPLLFIFVLVMRGLTLENADEGIRMYLMGIVYNEEKKAFESPDIVEKLTTAGIWTEACSQIFFSIGVCMGVMTSYSSYNPVDKPIIGDSLRVSIGNSLVSFTAGFAVFSVVGYLRGINSPVSGSVSSIGLAFTAYPAAIERMPAPNLWAFLFSITLFTLGLDSAFSLVEATSTVITDTAWGRKTPRKLIALLLCVVGLLFSTLFCFNWGFTFFDVIDHYLANYLMLLLGLLQCLGAGWVYEAGYVMEKANKRSVLILAIGFWGVMIPLGILAYTAFPNYSWVSIPIFWVLAFFVFVASFATSGLSLKEWYGTVFMYGVRKLSRSMVKLTKEPGTHPWWAGPFEFWWGFSIKYFIPWSLYWLILILTRVDLTSAYGGYHPFWQVMGFMFPILGLILFFVPLAFCTTVEPFDHDIDQAFDDMSDDAVIVKGDNRVGNEIELGETQKH